MTTSPKDRTAMALVALVGVFIIGSMVLLVTMAFLGTGDGEGERVWAGLFSLTTAILGAIAGWLGGSAAAARKPNPEVEGQGVEADGDLG